MQKVSTVWVLVSSCHDKVGPSWRRLWGGLGCCSSKSTSSGSSSLVPTLHKPLQQGSREMMDLFTVTSRLRTRHHTKKNYPPSYCRCAEAQAEDDRLKSCSWAALAVLAHVFSSFTMLPEEKKSQPQLSSPFPLDDPASTKPGRRTSEADRH